MSGCSVFCPVIWKSLGIEISTSSLGICLSAPAFSWEDFYSFYPLGAVSAATWVRTNSCPYSVQIRQESDSLFPQSPSRQQKSLPRSPISFLFYRLNKPKSFSFPLNIMYSSSQPSYHPFVALFPVINLSFTREFKLIEPYSLTLLKIRITEYLDHFSKPKDLVLGR